MAEEDESFVAALGYGVADILDGLPLGGFAGDENVDVAALEHFDLFEFAGGSG